MCESWSLPGPRGIIVANAFCSPVLPVVACLSGLRRAFSPQNVKNMVTSSSRAAAPVAMMNAAKTLSKSPLNTMMVFLVVSTNCVSPLLPSVRSGNRDPDGAEVGQLRPRTRSCT